MLSKGGSRRGVEGGWVLPVCCFPGFSGRWIGFGTLMDVVSSLPVSRLPRGDGRGEVSSDLRAVEGVSLSCASAEEGNGCGCFWKVGFDVGTGGFGGFCVPIPSN